MPDGYSVDLDQFHGLDQAGSTGLKDKVNNHYLEIFGASIALGIISGAAEATNANQGYNESGSEAYKTGIASSLSQSSANVLDRFVNIPPTITIRRKAIGSRSTSRRTCCCPRMKTTPFRVTSKSPLSQPAPTLTLGASEKELL